MGNIKHGEDVICLLKCVIKHVFICSILYIYTSVVQEVYNRDRSPEVMMLSGWQRLKKRDDAENSFRTENTRPFPL
jgi:hypothetical protein